jgi:hypothetical protein
MKLYKIKNGIVIEKENKFFLISQPWESFINDDNLFQKAETLTTLIDHGEENLIKELLPPIGDNQELWACGVT